MADANMADESIVAETKTEKILEVQPASNFLEHLDDAEREFIAKGIHNFAYRKEECYDEHASLDLKREIKAALKAIGSDSLIPESIIDNKIDTAVLPLGQKKGYWLRRLISKTGGETQKLLRGLEKVNMFLRNYGTAKRKAPVPSKKVTVPIETFKELEERAFNLDIKSTEVVEDIKPEPLPEIMQDKSEPTEKTEIANENDADSDTDPQESIPRRRHRRRHRVSKRVRFYEPSDSESSEESDESDNDFQYYYKRLKRPQRVYSFRKPTRKVATYRPAPEIRLPKQTFDPVLFDTNVPIKPIETAPETPRPFPYQPNYVAPTHAPNNAYINHFLGNSRR